MWFFETVLFSLLLKHFIPERRAKSGFHNGKGMGSSLLRVERVLCKKIAGGRNLESGAGAARALLSPNAREEVACNSWTASSQAALGLQKLDGIFGEAVVLAVIFWHTK